MRERSEIRRLPQSDREFSRWNTATAARSLREMSDGRFRCDTCGEVIGVYEPLVVIVDGEAVQSSRAAAHWDSTDGPRFHGACYARLRSTSETPVE